ncbi:helix-turn-helix domain-containing protein [Methylobacterium planeticum]|uniref:Uncharacterized protein n=1 Tax=Methylobacterium planeticum TaxID=2615211 RepID=A0A6N6MG58_9HYPH|nr:hypothetical protein [Methylobacterium planeticum]KAB1068822.1 hypothetical protein F6X51_26265 [Methylobacterium planeticum]
MLENQLSALIGAATTPERLNEIAGLVWRALGAEEISEDGASRLAQAIQARRPRRSLGLGLEVVDGGQAAAPVRSRTTFFPPKRRQRSPDRQASIERRRTLASSGPMPPALAAHFTEGERAVLKVLADEVEKAGQCDRSIDELAARAGVSRTVAKNALRTAEKLILIVVHRRPQEGRKNLTNLVAIVSLEWKAWIARRKRKAIGVGMPSPSDIRNSRKGRQGPAEPSKESARRRKAGSSEPRGGPSRFAVTDRTGGSCHAAGS